MKHDEIRELGIKGDFTDEEWSERKQHITTLRSFAGSSVEAAKALAKIRDKKLYRPHTTLKEFCQRECGWTERRLFQVIAFAKVRASLPPEKRTIVQSEGQARELKRVPEEKRVEVLDKASDNGEVTAKSIRVAAKQIEKVEVDKAGMPIPPLALPYWERRTEILDILNHISAARSQIRDISDADPLYRRIGKFGEMRMQLDEIYRQFKGILPEYVCGYCAGHNPDGCRGCNGTGVLSEYMRKQMPAKR